MKISPRELREAQIPSKAFGFNQDVVDALLERAADTIEGLIEENRQLFEALENVKSQNSSMPAADPFAGVAQEKVSPAPVPAVVPAPAVVSPAVDIGGMSEKEELINRTLLLAQKTADETLRTAKSQADEIVMQAQSQAEEMVTKAKTDAENLTGSAREEALQNVKTAESQAQQLVSSAQGQADELLAEAQNKADALYKEEREKYIELISQLTSAREQLISDISILQGFDQEHRTKLREAVQDDLAKLESRETIDVSSVPELPAIESILPEVVAHSGLSKASEGTFDEAIATDETDNSDDEVLISEEIEIEDNDIIAPASEEDADPFAAFVDSDDTEVVAPAGSGLDSSSPSNPFDPGQGSKQQSDLDDDDFFASLREAVKDDAPLGPSEDDEKDSRSKG